MKRNDQNSQHTTKEKNMVAAKKSSAKNDSKKQRNDLTKEDIPDSTNTSTGKLGSGQRQDSN